MNNQPNRRSFFGTLFAALLSPTIFFPLLRNKNKPKISDLRIFWATKKPPILTQMSPKSKVEWAKVAESMKKLEQHFIRRIS